MFPDYRRTAYKHSRCRPKHRLYGYWESVGFFHFKRCLIAYVLTSPNHFARKHQKRLNVQKSEQKIQWVHSSLPKLNSNQKHNSPSLLTMLCELIYGCPISEKSWQEKRKKLKLDNLSNKKNIRFWSSNNLTSDKFQYLLKQKTNTRKISSLNADMKECKQ